MWQEKDRKLQVKLVATKGAGVSVLAAISTKQSTIVHYVVPRQGKEAVLELAHKIGAKALEPKRTIVCLDNLKSHYNDKVKGYLRRKGIGLLFTPPSSSSLNAAETIFSIFKKRWGQFLTTNSDRDLDEMTHAKLIQDVKGQMARLNVEVDGSSLTRVIYEEIDKVLDGFKV